MVAMAMFTACSEDDNTPNPNPEPEPNPNPDVTVEGYSSDLFVAEANHNVIEYDFSNTFKDGFIGTIDGGADMPKVNEFLKRQHIVGAVSADNNWTEGWIRTSGNGDETSANAEEILQGELTTNKTLEANKSICTLAVTIL